jgi:uncharacterized protein YbjT (DUF2867 family)
MNRKFEQMGKTVNLIGATGLVGHALLKQLLESKEVDRVRVFTRRATGLVHPRLQEQVIDFSDIEQYRDLLVGDVLYSTLGTTLKKAGSKEAQYLVDFTFQWNFARIAAENGISSYGLVSSAGANARSSIFYTRIKGELDEAVQKLPFRNCVILRPSILDGERKENRPAEKIGLVITRAFTKLFFRKYRPIHAEIVAQALIESTLLKPKDGFTLAELDDIFILAGEKMNS